MVRAYNDYGTSSNSDEIGTKTLHDIVPGHPITIGDEGEEITIEISGSGCEGANLITPVGGYSPVPNAAFMPTSEGVIRLIGTGNVDISISTDDLWYVYRQGGGWVLEEGPLENFIITVNLGAKDADFEFKSGNGGNPTTLPVELSTFTVNLNAANNAVLTWVTQSETGVSGFYVFRNISPDLGNASLISALVPATNTSQLHTYVHTDSEVPGPGTYYYWLQAVDIDGSDSFYGPLPLIYSGQPDVNPSAPQVTELKGIYPNPFNPSATLSYALASKAEVRLQIFNSRGQLVRSLNEGSKNPGSYSLIWDGTDDGAQSQATGVYFFRLHAGDKVFNSKAVLLK